MNDSLDNMQAEDADDGEIVARNLRVLEALLFAAKEPLVLDEAKPFLSDGADVEQLATQLQLKYQHAGVNLVKRGDAFAFRTAQDLGFLLRREETERKPLSRAALEIMAIIAYHQPVTRSEIEEVRGVATSKGTLDVLMEAGWVRMRGRRRTPGRPVTYGTTPEFLDQFGLETITDLPGLNELKGTGLLSANLPPNFSIPSPNDGDLFDNEDPLDADDEGDDLLTELSDDDLE
ncbi:SMC-Scp complex subunit ScpB [Maritalea sp.]|uniref:SMC-Scp complex subunit ScpB n=1 Tax=Maritalea sp. TaxID=2003361 RepID=UPI003EF71FD9